MKNKMTDLRNHLFATLEALQDPDNPMDVHRARAVAEVSTKIIDSAKLEFEVMQEFGVPGTGFIPMDSEAKGALPPPLKAISGSGRR